MDSCVYYIGKFGLVVGSQWQVTTDGYSWDLLSVSVAGDPDYEHFFSVVVLGFCLGITWFAGEV